MSQIEIKTETTVALRMPGPAFQAIATLVNDAVRHSGWSATNEAQVGTWRDQFPHMSSDDWAVLQTAAPLLAAVQF